jgi:signal transduction histidine kinase
VDGIIGMTELTMDTLLSPEQREYLKMVHSYALGIRTIINDIIHFER